MKQVQVVKRRNHRKKCDVKLTQAPTPVQSGDQWSLRGAQHGCRSRWELRGAARLGADQLIRGAIAG